MSKILIIEDEKAMSDLIAIKFKVEGMEVDQAFTVAEAKQKLSQPQPYDAILSDYLLPDGNALDLLAEVKKLPQVANVPIVMATNYVEDLSADKAKSLGINEVIVKYQVVPAQMVEKVKALLTKGGETPTSDAAPGPQPTPDPAAQSEPVPPANNVILGTAGTPESNTNAGQASITENAQPAPQPPVTPEPAPSDQPVHNPWAQTEDKPQ